MNAVDTNVLVYRLDRTEPVKRVKARGLIRQLRIGTTPTLLLWQVAGEFLQRLRVWRNQGRIPPDGPRRCLQALLPFFQMEIPRPAVLGRALDLAERYSLSHWDSMLLGACIEAGVTTLYTEDMGAPTQYDSVQLVNPFI